MDVDRQDDSRRRGRPEQLVERRLRVGGHLRVRLGPEVLDDHLLDVPVALVQAGDRPKGLDPLRSRLADPDQDPGRERNRQLAREANRLQPCGGALVGRAEVRTTALGEPVGDRLEHEALRGGHLAQPGELVACHHTGVCVRKEAGLVEHEAAHAREVLDRRLAPELGQLLARDPVAALGLVAEREQRLAATRRGAGACDLEHFVRGQVRPLAAARRPREGAVVADVPAELRQRDENLRRICDDGAPAQAPGLGEQVFEGPVEHAMSIRAVPLPVMPSSF